MNELAVRLTKRQPPVVRRIAAGAGPRLQVAGLDPRTITFEDILANTGLNSPIPVVSRNLVNPISTSGGPGEFPDVVALQATGTQDTPYPLLHLDTSGQTGIGLSYVLRDIDGTADNAIQQFTAQYRVGSSGTWTNLDGTYVPDATSGPSLAVQVTTKPVTVQVNGKLVCEPDETFVVALTNPSGAVILDGSATGTIQNDDDCAPPSASVTSPDGGELAGIGSTLSLEWTASDDFGVVGVDLYLSRDGGTVFETIALDQPNDGDYDWTVTGPATAQAVLKVVARDAVGGQGEDSSDGTWTIQATTSVGDGVAEFGLDRISPNPARASVRIDFAVAREARVRLTVVDLQGRRVATLVDGVTHAGRHQTVWRQRGSRPAAGLYFVRYEVEGRTYLRRLVVL